MEDIKKQEFDVFKLMQPELLSHEELVDILRERGVGPVLLSQSKEKLVSLFKRVALPLPQRELRDNYRGNLLKKLRKKAERIRIGDSPPSDLKGFTIGISGNPSLTKINSEEEKMTCERLKPPPDLVNYNRKKIRLNSGSSSSVVVKTSQSSDLDNIVIKKRKTSEGSSESHPNKNGATEGMNECATSSLKIEKQAESQLVSNKGNEEKTINGDKTSSVPCKKVSLKRNRFVTATTASPASEPATKKAEPETEKLESATDKSKLATAKPEIATEKSPSEPEKKRKPITWP